MSVPELLCSKPEFIDDPAYISGLPSDHSLKARENVYAFAMSCASMQVLQMLSYTIAPADISNPGAQLYHFVNGNMEAPQFGTCKATCQFPSLIDGILTYILL